MGGRVTVKVGGITMESVDAVVLVPIIRGGKSTKGNLVPNCKKCNSARQHGLPFERTGD